MALAVRRRGITRRTFPRNVVWHSAKPALAGDAKARRRGPGSVAENGRGRPAAGVAGNRQLRARGAPGAVRAAIPLEIPVADFSGHYHRYVQPTLRHKRYPLLFE